MSPEVAKAIFGEDTHPMYHFLGTTVITRHDQCGKLKNFGGKAVLETLDGFIKAGPKPIYVGWGSMISGTPEDMVAFCCKAIRRSGQRAVVLGGFAGLSRELLETAGVDKDLLEYAKENILFVHQAPHEWLLPQTAATVHHGGAGTTTAALRAGVPTIITPVFLDQYDFSYAVRELQVGVGFEKQLQQIGYEELGDAIRQVVSDRELACRAASLGVKLRAEDGATKAADHVEAYWKDYCVSGIFHERFPFKVDHEQDYVSV